MEVVVNLDSEIVTGAIERAPSGAILIYGKDRSLSMLLRWAFETLPDELTPADVVARLDEAIAYFDLAGFTVRAEGSVIPWHNYDDVLA